MTERVWRAGHTGSQEVIGTQGQALSPPTVESQSGVNLGSTLAFKSNLLTSPSFHLQRPSQGPNPTLISLVSIKVFELFT